MRLVHLARASLERGIRRAGLVGAKATIQDDTGAPLAVPRAVFAMPVVRDSWTTFQWLRELRRGHDERMIAVYFHVPDDELVRVGRFYQPHALLSAAAAAAWVTRHPAGAQIVVPHAIRAAHIRAIRQVGQLVGWTVRPEQSRASCLCQACFPRGDRHFNNPVATDAFIDMMLRVCDALSYAHARGIVHRDLKPENIMVGQHGEVYVMDWGCAGPFRQAPDAPPIDDPVIIDATFDQLDLDGMVMGTASFMSPEQARGAIDEIDPRTDVFGVGALLYVALARQPPYPAAHILVALQTAREGNPPSPDKIRPAAALSAGLVAITMRAIAADVEDRFQSIAELREALVTLRRRGWFESVSFATGELLCAINEPGEVAYILRSGTAVAYRMEGEHRVIVAELGEGDVVGETSLFTGRVRGTNVEATSPVEAMRLTRESVERELGARTWAGSIVRALAYRFSDVDSRLTSTQRQLKRYRVLERIRSLLRIQRQGLPVVKTAADLELDPDDLRDLADAAPDLEYHQPSDMIRRAP